MDTPIPRKVTILVEYDDGPIIEIEVPREQPDDSWGWPLGSARIEMKAEVHQSDLLDARWVDEFILREPGVEFTVRTDKIATLPRLDRLPTAIPDEVLDLLHAFAAHEDSGCAFDHHGYCQEHSGSLDDDRCAIPVARALLEREGRL